jgi:hypothetical protein
MKNNSNEKARMRFTLLLSKSLTVTLTMKKIKLAWRISALGFLSLYFLYISLFSTRLTFLPVSLVFFPPTTFSFFLFLCVLFPYNLNFLSIYFSVSVSLSLFLSLSLSLSIYLSLSLSISLSDNLLRSTFPPVKNYFLNSNFDKLKLIHISLIEYLV